MAGAIKTGGRNYGWKILEGARCFSPSVGCNGAGTTLPTLDIAHGAGDCSVIGGYVYRGDHIPELDRHYFWSDFCTRELSTFKISKKSATQQTTWLTAPSTSGIHSGGDDGPAPGFVTSLGRGGDGELYLATFGGSVYKIESRR